MATHSFETSGFEPFSGTLGTLASDPLPEISSAPDEFAATKGWACASERRAGRPLSPRERQILTLIIEGKRPKEVAYDLAIAHSTVRVIYSRAMKKLGGLWQPRGRRA
jgi:DNA-binding CsgD family transcriptional regulator